MKRQFQTFNFSIKNASTDAVDIYIDGQIVDAETQEIFKKWFGDETSVSYKSFRDQIKSHDVKTYNVYINSGGGLVTDAMAMHDLLNDMQTRGKVVNTFGRGIIASAATYILMAGNQPEMSKNSWLMIHNVSGFAYGDVNQVESAAKTMRQFNDSVRDFYSRATGLRKEDISKMMNAETWMTADDAKEKGFIKSISNEAAFTNSIPKEHWEYSNMAVLNSYNASVKPEQAENSNQTQFDDMKKFLNDLAASIKAGFAGVKAPENNDHAALMASIGDVIVNSFATSSDQMELANTEAINTAVANGLAAQNDRIAALEAANADLEKEITNVKGSATGTKKEAEGPEIVGKFS